MIFFARCCDTKENNQGESFANTDMNVFHMQNAWLFLRHQFIIFSHNFSQKIFRKDMSFAYVRGCPKMTFPLGEWVAKR